MQTTRYDFNSPDTVSVYDELPLWSSRFGWEILNRVIFKENAVILDAGCGTGFPLLEIAQRFGADCKAYGVDPWKEALKRAQYKADVMDINNITLIEGSAEKLPFPDNYFDLITSNNGINNMENQSKALTELYRTAKTGAQFLMTVNLPGTMKEFYEIYEEVLKEENAFNELKKLKEHIHHKRKDVNENRDMIESSGFKIKECRTDYFYMRFINGTAMLNYYFIKLCFKDSWTQITGSLNTESIFNKIEQKLNSKAKENGELTLTIPYVCFDCIK